MNYIEKNNKTLSVLSYNIWFDDYLKQERLHSLIYNIMLLNPDVICLQEVMSDVYNIIKNKFPEYNFYPKKMDRKYGCIIMSKHNIKMAKTIELTSSMCRNLLIALIEVRMEYMEKDMICCDNKMIVITNCHYESEFKKNNINKIAQYNETLKYLNDIYYTYGTVIHCADTNITELEEEKYITKDESWKDSWIEAGSDKEDCYTYDYNTNENLQERNIKLRSRIDRIVYRDNNNLDITDFRLIRGDNLYIQPSDHHGVYVQYDIISGSVEI